MLLRFKDISILHIFPIPLKKFLPDIWLKEATIPEGPIYRVKEIISFQVLYVVTTCEGQELRQESGHTSKSALQCSAIKSSTMHYVEF